jgi:hypothetical protein
VRGAAGAQVAGQADQGVQGFLVGGVGQDGVDLVAVRAVHQPGAHASFSPDDSQEGILRCLRPARQPSSPLNDVDTSLLRTGGCMPTTRAVIVHEPAGPLRGQ